MPMKIKIARHISPAAIAIALFLAVALLTHGGTITDNRGADYFAMHPSSAATPGVGQDFPKETVKRQNKKEINL